MPKPKKHKRKRSKGQRAGCLFCKPHKLPASKRSMPTRQEARARIVDKEAQAYR